jgi:hypothetical protein
MDQNGSIRQLNRIASHIEHWESILSSYAPVRVTHKGASIVDLGSRDTSSQKTLMWPGALLVLRFIAVFPNAESPRGRFLAAVERAALKNYTWHCNRHTFASRLVMAGVDLHTVGDSWGTEQHR